MANHTAFQDLDAKTIRVLGIYPTDRGGKTIAFAVVEFGLWIVRSLRLMRHDDGTYWVAMPGEKDKEGHWRDVCFVPARAARERLYKAVWEAYQEVTADSDTGAKGESKDESLPF